jgi:hypothetical protein
VREQIGIERLFEQGIQEGKILKGQENIVRVLEVRFEDVSLELRELVGRIDDLEVLENLLYQAVTTPSLDEFESVANQFVADEESEEEEDNS